MANGVVTGLVKSVRESSFMLDDGNWYGVHPDSDLELPNVGDFAAVGFYTKSSKTGAGWRTYRNVTAIRFTDVRVDFKRTNAVLESVAEEFKFFREGAEQRKRIEEKAKQRAEAPADYDDDIPF